MEPTGEGTGMSFMDEMRQHHQTTRAHQSEERRRLTEISRQIIQDEIGHNYREVLLTRLKEGAQAIFASKGKIEVMCFNLVNLRLDPAITECDIPTIETYLRGELDAAVDSFDAEVDGAGRHKEKYYGARGGRYPALVKSVIGHRYVPPEDEYHQPYWFSISVSMSYYPPLI